MQTCRLVMVVAAAIQFAEASRALGAAAEAVGG
jgi:hypothetical protein